MNTWLTRVKISELLDMHERVLDELRSRGVLRTSNGPWADYAEFLVAHLFVGSILAPPSQKSADVVTADGRRIQVKARMVRPDAQGSRELSAIRSFDFDELAVVLFQRGAQPVLRASLIPVEVVRSRCTPRRHTNSHRLIATEALLSLPEVRDITNELRRVRDAAEVQGENS
jgi:hypothetical protein